MDGNDSGIFVVEGQTDSVEMTVNSIQGILSYSMSPNGTRTAIATKSGVIIVNNYTYLYKSFQNEESPFFINQSNVYGVSLTSVLDDRPEVAIVPNSTTRKFNKTSIYVFDFSMKTILYTNDFILPIAYFSMTNSHLVVSNSKRIIIYDYRNDFSTKNEAYYMSMYKSKEPNNRLRYLEINCHQSKEQYADKLCPCGQFVMSHSKPFVLVYLQIHKMGEEKQTWLIVYDQCIDKQYLFKRVPFESNFSFCISFDAHYMAFTNDSGTKIQVYSLRKECLYCVLYVGRQVKPILNCGFFMPTGKGVWFVVTRGTENQQATTHLFPIEEQTISKEIKSLYKRNFNLYLRTFRDYQISQSIIAPAIFLKGKVLHLLSFVGEFGDIINFDMQYLDEKKKIDTTFIRWEPEKA